MATTISTSPEIVDSNETTNSFNSENTIAINSIEEPIGPTQTQLIQQPAGKHQMLPVVYIQAPSKTTPIKTSNVTFNTVPTLQKQNMFTTIGSQSLLIGKQPIILSKPPNVHHVPKNGVTYLTMVNPARNVKGAETNLITSNRQPITTIKSVIAAPNACAAQKYIISPMPKLTSNRLPVTATTNSVQPKLAFMPLSSMPSKSKVYNFKISDGLIQTENNKSITVMSEKPQRREPVAIRPKGGLYCDEIIDIDNVDKKEEKSYQLSIIEDSNSRNDAGFTISINEDEDKSKFNFRETPKFSKHGVSILKKTYSFLDRKERPKTPKLSFKSITTISDTSTKEVQITSEQSIDQQPVKKNERRRKSTLCLRKDYDDPEIKIEEETERPKKMPKLEIIKEIILPKDRNLLMITNLEDIKQETEIKTETVDFDEMDIKENIVHEDDQDVAKLLNWDDGIGTLPGSDLKFRINEFSFIEYLTKDEFRKILYKKQAKARENEKKKMDGKEEMRCLECGCFGMPSEFICPKYCSYDCQNAGQMKETVNKIKKMKKKRDKQDSKQQWYKKQENGNLRDSRSSEDDNSSNENSMDKFNYPWYCSKKGFSWVKYLDHVKAKSAPVKLFKDPFPYNRNGFRPGMKLEGVDPQHPSFFCVLTVSEVQGYRVRLHFDGYSENYDFWVNADSMDIFQAGFCEKYGHTLHPPPGYETNFSWNCYLKLTHSPAAPKHLFANRLANNAIFPNGFRTGMKLEAVDRKNNALVCVSTIRDMMDNRILIHFDSWDDIYDYWADPTSPYIHPVGWCDQNGHSLTSPNGYPNPETFTWEGYLKESKSVGAPVRAFKQRPVCGFKKGMRLECVDRRVPQIIRVANVDDVKDHQIRISFDGWPDRYSYWVDDDSPNIHPVGWCQKTGHPIEPPLTPDDVYDFLECPTVGCRGQGHIGGPKYTRHSTQKNCPYAEENIDQEKIVPDRLLSPTRQIEAAVPVSREPRDKSKNSTPPTKFEIDSRKIQWIEEEAPKPKRMKLIKCKSESSPDIEKRNKKVLLSLYEDEEDPDVTKMREKYSSYLQDYISNEVDPCEWTYTEVANFVASLPCCRNNGAMFSRHYIDGFSFLMLTQNDLIELLNFKLGPAITLYNCILILRNDSMQCI